MIKAALVLARLRTGLYWSYSDGGAYDRRSWSRAGYIFYSWSRSYTDEDYWRMWAEKQGMLE